MTQTWHIFKKDIRYLYREIAFLFVLAAMSGWVLNHTRGEDTANTMSLLYSAGVVYTIARLVHAEAIPGDNQFWITRPYRRASLLAAKILFVFAFVQIPVLIMQVSILLRDGFSIGHILPGLLWTQVLILLGISLPVCAIAAMTTGMVPIVGAILAMIAIAFGAMEVRMELIQHPESVGWVRFSIPLLASVLAVPPVLYLQYWQRRTLLSAVLAGGVALGGLGLFCSIPWTTLFSVQSHFSHQNVDVRIARASTRTSDVLVDVNHHVSMAAHFSIQGVPPGTYPQIESFDPQIQTGDGRILHLGSADLSIRRDEDNVNEFTLRNTRLMRPEVLEDSANKPVRMWVSFYLTLVGNRRDKTIPFRATPVDAMDGLRCHDDAFDGAVCVAPFRWPGRYVSVKSPWGGLTPFTRLISFSPFPASLQISPLENRSAGRYWLSNQPRPSELTIEVEEPIAWLRRDVELRISEGK